MASARELRYMERCKKRKERGATPSRQLKRLRSTQNRQDTSYNKDMRKNDTSQPCQNDTSQPCQNDTSQLCQNDTSQPTETSSIMYEIGRKLCRKPWATSTMNNTELTTQTDLLQQLGGEYMKLAEATSEGWYFVRASGCYNAALRCIEKLKNIPEDATETDISRIISKETDCLKQLQHIETSFLAIAACQNYKTAKQHKELYKTELNSLREFSSKRINDIVRNDMRVDSITTEMSVEDEDSTIKNSKVFYNELSDRLKQFYRLLIDDCISVLEVPDCKFSVLGLGSLARMEATAYSDLESAILFDSIGMTTDEIEKAKHRFRLMVHYLHLKVLNLGETILPSLCIPVLNDFNTELPDHMTDNKYFDITTPQGMCFDGAMPWASKTPIGRNKTKLKPARELIMTPEEMAEYQTESICIKEGYHLSDVLMTTTLIYGDEGLLEKYNTNLQKILNSPSKKDSSISVGALRADETLKDDLNKYLQNPLTPETLGKQVHVKKDIYRFATISVNTLKLKYNCVSQAPLDVLEELYDRKILSERAKKDLQVMVCICINLRHLVYNGYKQQKEIISFIPGTGSTGTGPTSLSVRDFNAIYRFFLTFMPWSEFLKLSIENPETHWTHMPRYIDTSEKVKGMLHKEMYFFENALLAFQKEETRLQSLGVDKNEELATIQASIGSLFTTHGKYQDAFEHHIKALDLEKQIHSEETHPHVAESLNSTGNVCCLQGEYTKSLKYHKEALDIYKYIHGESNHKQVTRTLSFIGKVYWRLGDYNNALSHQNKCLHIYREMFGDKPDLDYANALNATGVVYAEQEDAINALPNFTKSLEMRQLIYGCVPHPDIAASLNNIGDMYYVLQDYSTSMAYHNQSLAMTKQIFGDVPHNRISGSLNNIGEVYERLGDITKALEFFNDSLAMNRQVYGHKPHPYIARTLYNIGNVHKSLGEHTKALDHYHERLAMMKVIYEDKPHPFVVQTLEKIVEVYEALGDMTNAEQYRGKCMEIKNRLDL